MTNINHTVWEYIDERIEIKKTLLNNLINISALARKIAEEKGLEDNIDAIISAIRRYEGKKEVLEHYSKLYTLIKRAKISTKTKLASIVVRRNDETEKKVASIYSKVDFKRESTLRVFEMSNYIKIIIEDEFLKQVKDLFTDKETESVEKGLGELTINYRDDITKIPGVFATLANEIAMNNISIIDSMICQWEHLFIVYEKDLESAFSVVLSLTR